METIGSRVKYARLSARLTQSKLGELIGISGKAISQWESGRTEPTNENLRLVSRFTGLRTEWLETGRGPRVADTSMLEYTAKPIVEEIVQSAQQIPLGPKMAMVGGMVAAGTWMEAEMFDDEQPFDPVPCDTQIFPDFPQIAYKITGNSVDKLGILNGDIVLAIDYDELKLQPKTGDIVIVERKRGGLIERTCKQIEIKPDRWEFWPRSSDPRWQPIIIHPGNGDGEIDEEVTVVARVIAIHRSIL